MPTPRKRKPTTNLEPGEITVIRMDCPCGWCLTGHCGSCKGELLSDKKLYMCSCEKCCDGHVPSIGLELKQDETDSD